jgi:hypothetical protein
MKKSVQISAKTAKVSRGRRVRRDFALFTEGGAKLRKSDTSDASSLKAAHQFITRRIILTQEGKPVGAIVPLEDLSLLEQTEDARDAAVYRAALKKAKREKTMDWDTVKKELGL